MPTPTFPRSRKSLFTRAAAALAVTGVVLVSSGGIAGAATKAPKAGPGEVIYRVRKGDVLSTIARKYKVTSKSILDRNRLANADKIKYGTYLRISIIPAPAPQPRATVIAIKPAATSSPSSLLPSSLRNSPERLALMNQFNVSAQRYSLPPDLLKSLAWQESGWQRNAISSTGAQGIGQILPSTAKFINRDLLHKNLNPWVPQENIEMSARYLRYLIDLNKGNESFAIGSYYQGYTSIKKNGLKLDTIAYINSIQKMRSKFV